MMQCLVAPFLGVIMFAADGFTNTNKDKYLGENLVDCLTAAIVMQDVQEGHIVVRYDQNFFDQIKAFILGAYDFNVDGRINTVMEIEAVVEQ